MHTSLITPKIVNKNIDNPNWRFIDCRFALSDPEKKQVEFALSHIPGSIYAHVNRDLSGSHIPGETGRHPLPEKQKLIKLFSNWGIDHSVQVVIFDDSGGAYAVRLWWLLRWLGHDVTAVMDGGWPRWIREGRPVTATVTVKESKKFKATLREKWSIKAENIIVELDNSEVRILDARNSDRFKGTNETIDIVSGHIPGAVSAPFIENLDADGNWKSKSELRQRFENLLSGSPAKQAVSYCGSGITACHNIFAMYHSGLGDSRLYSGSWSDWITDPRRPVA